MDPLSALTVLARLGERCPNNLVYLAQALEGRPHLFADCLAVAEGGWPRELDSTVARIVSGWPSAQACAFHNRLPEHTTSLRETGLAVTAACWQILEARGDTTPDSDRFRAEIGNNLVARLSELGRYDAAVERAAGLIDYFRPRADSSREQTHYLARSLSSQGMALGGAGLVQEAVTAYHEAAGLLRRLADQADSDTDLDLGLVLNNLAGQCLAAGQTDAAVTAVLESVAIHRRYRDRAPGPEREPRRNRANLAAALGALANALVADGQFAAAYEAAQEAAAILAVVKEDRPARFTDQWAMALVNLAMTEQRLDHLDDAVAHLRTAAGEYQRMADAYPDAFLADCAKVHRNLVIGLLRLGDRHEALNAAATAFDCAAHLSPREPPPAVGPAEEALSLYLQLEPYKHLGRTGLQRLDTMVATLLGRTAARRLVLIDTLIKTGRALKEADRAQEALVLIRAAADAARPLADQAEGGDAPTLLCSALVQCLSIQTGSPQPEAVREIAEQALHRLEILARGDEGDRANASLLLNNLANALSWFDLPEQAGSAARLAVGLLRDLADQDRERFEPQLAVALNTLARRRQALGLTNEALTSARESCSRLAPFAQASPDRYGDWMAEMADFERRLAAPK